jgi:hypothetical protein
LKRNPRAVRARQVVKCYAMSFSPNRTGRSFDPLVEALPSEPDRVAAVCDEHAGLERVQGYLATFVMGDPRQSAEVKISVIQKGLPRRSATGAARVKASSRPIASPEFGVLLPADCPDPAEARDPLTETTTLA